MSWRDQFRSAFATLWGHHLNQSFAMDRAFTAKARGLDEDKFATPFTQHVTNYQNTQSPSPLRGLLSGAALAAALLGGGGIGGFLLSNWLSPKPEAQTVEKLTKEVWDSSVELEVEPPQ